MGVGWAEIEPILQWHAIYLEQGYVILEEGMLFNNLYSRKENLFVILPEAVAHGQGTNNTPPTVQESSLEVPLRTSF